MKRTISLLVLLVVLVPVFNMVLAQEDVSCPFTYEGMEETWNLDEDVPDDLVRQYVEDLCGLHTTVQSAISGSASAEDIESAQETFVASFDTVRAYWTQHSPKLVADLDTIEAWLNMVETANIIPADYELSEGEPNCPFGEEGEDYHIEECDHPIIVTADDFEGFVDFWGTRFVQDFETFSIFRSCVEPITEENIEDAWSCEVTWITQRRGEETRGLTGYALVNYDWKVTQ